VSIDPILAVLQLRAPVHRPPSIVAISPIIGGQTVKGPAAKMFVELGIEPSPIAVAEHYENFLTGIVVDSVDSKLVNRIKIPFLVTNTLMKSITDRARLAEETLKFAGNLRK
jgi:LPPG:FO 2-phospho-L-lactate transferase